jgi:hypothetical protein
MTSKSTPGFRGSASRYKRDIPERLHKRSLQFSIHAAQNFVGILILPGYTASTQ